jgi:hypothetical protein
LTGDKHKAEKRWRRGEKAETENGKDILVRAEGERRQGAVGVVLALGLGLSH